MAEPWVLIIVLCIVTFLSRLMGVEIMAGRVLNPTLRLYFNFVPIAIMVALIVDQIFTTNHGSSSISLPILGGSIAAALMIKVTRSFLLTVVIGILVGLGIRYWLHI